MVRNPFLAARGGALVPAARRVLETGAPVGASGSRAKAPRIFWKTFFFRGGTSNNRGGKGVEENKAFSTLQGTKPGMKVTALCSSLPAPGGCRARPAAPHGRSRGREAFGHHLERVLRAQPRSRCGTGGLAAPGGCQQRPPRALRLAAAHSLSLVCMLMRHPQLS